MKKCASCSKDLPDAALHCVFCGAKQPPTQAPQGLAKTVMGYSASEMIEQMKQQQSPARPAPAPAPPAFSPPPAARPQPVASPAPRPQPAPLPPTMAEPPQPRFTGNSAPTAYAQPAGYSPPSGPAPMVPSSGSNAPTMFANSSPAPQPSYPAPAPMGSGPGPSMGGPSMGGPMPRSGPTPAVPMPHNVAPAPAAPPPYLASQTAARAGRPIEPWKDSLRFTMFVWGAVLLAVFAVPISIDPLIGYWNIVADGEGTMKLPPLIMASVGLLGIVIGSIPMSPAPRGLIAAVLGFVGIVMPTILALVAGASPSWQSIVGLVAMLTLIPGLLVRQEYRDSVLPRILVTIGVIAALAPYLVPVDSGVPLVNLFKALIDADAKGMVLLLVTLLQIVVVVLSLLVWLPAPSSAMAKTFAWLLILWPLVVHVTTLLLHADEIVDALKASPNLALFGPLMEHADKKAAVMPVGWAAGAAYAAITSYGLATVFGKQLE